MLENSIPLVIIRLFTVPGGPNVSEVDVYLVVGFYFEMVHTNQTLKSISRYKHSVFDNLHTVIFVIYV